MSTPKDASFLNGPGEGEAYWVVGAKGTLKGPRVIEIENPPGWDVPLHVHDSEDEVHYYLEGSVTVRIGDATYRGTPGSLCFLPKGIPHALTFDADGPARWLWISPEDRSDFAREVGVPATQPEPKEEDIDMERTMAIFEKHGMRFLDEH